MKNKLRKAQPMLLTAAFALTLMSIIASLAMTGLVQNYYASTPKTKLSEIYTNNAVQVLSNKEFSSKQSMLAVLNSPVMERTENNNCNLCGKIVALDVENVEYVSALPLQYYVIKVELKNGSYQTITQYSKPEYHVGEFVRLNSKGTENT